MEQLNIRNAPVQFFYQEKTQTSDLSSLSSLNFRLILHTTHVFTSSLCPCFPWQKGIGCKEGPGGPSWGPSTLPQSGAFYSPLPSIAAVTSEIIPSSAVTDLSTLLCCDTSSPADRCSQPVTPNISDVKLLINSACWILQWNLCGRRWLMLRMLLHILALQLVQLCVDLHKIHV